MTGISFLATTAHSFCSLRRGSEIPVLPFCLRPAQPAHPSMRRFPNQSLSQGKDYKLPFAWISETFGAREALPPFPKLLTDISFLEMIGFIQGKFAASTDVWAHGRVCPAARDGVKWNTCLCIDLVKGTIAPLDCDQDLRRGSERENSPLLDPMLLQGTCLQMNTLLLLSSILQTVFGLKRAPSVESFPFCF